MDDPHSLTGRMIRAAKLEVDLYEEVEADTTANGQAFQAVIIASVASGLGYAIWGLISEGGGWFFGGLALGIAASVIGWLVWSVLAYWVGTTFFKTPETSATVGELMRTIGFSNSPRVLAFFAFIPILGALIAFAVSVWALIAGVVAVRQALDFSTWRAIGTCIVGWLVYTILLSIVGFIVA